MVSVSNARSNGIPQLAAGVNAGLQGGNLPNYIAAHRASVVLAMAAALLPAGRRSVWPACDAWPGAGALGAGALIVSGAVAGCRAADRLVLLLATGLVGFGCGVLFLFTGAPDVAYTQFVVETVFVIVVASVLIRLKRQGRRGLTSLARPGASPLLRALGAVLTALARCSPRPAPLTPACTDFFANRSVPEAYGRNVVNVILVDFRALDTLGEITVVMLSFLAAWPLLQALRARRTRH